MTDLYLGIIAASVAVMALIQIAGIVVAARAARGVREAVERLEQDIRPIVANVQTMSSEVARASSLAMAQMQRAEEKIAQLSRRIDETTAILHSTIVTPAREAYAVVQGILAALGTFRSGPGEPPRKRPSPAEEEDPLFIG